MRSKIAAKASILFTSLTVGASQKGAESEEELGGAATDGPFMGGGQNVEDGATSLLGLHPPHSGLGQDEGSQTGRHYRQAPGSDRRLDDLQRSWDGQYACEGPLALNS